MKHAGEKGLTYITAMFVRKARKKLLSIRNARIAYTILVVILAVNRKPGLVTRD
jgi:hypothetical protein